MEWKDLAPWIAIAITLGLSILVPLFTQIANNRHQRKMQKEKIEYEQNQKKIDAYENFLMNVGAAIEYRNADALRAAGSSIGQLYLYVPEKMQGKLDSLFSSIRNYRWDEAEIKYFELTKLICSENLKNQK